jgi:hypothetical protein
MPDPRLAGLIRRFANRYAANPHCP